ncbi:hypothetical protein ABPG72_011108 [Tetrahymena utriculariae]
MGCILDTLSTSNCDQNILQNIINYQSQADNLNDSGKINDSSKDQITRENSDPQRQLSTDNEIINQFHQNFEIKNLNQSGYDFRIEQGLIQDEKQSNFSRSGYENENVNQDQAHFYLQNSDQNYDQQYNQYFQNAKIENYQYDLEKYINESYKLNNDFFKNDFEQDICDIIQNQINLAESKIDLNTIQLYQYGNDSKIMKVELDNIQLNQIKII